tara:strand:- start:485 stop:946 length:462 start_codon:yes stop_codon:yes gene_type:complete
MTTIAISCDHAGYRLKEYLVAELRLLGYEVLDLGTDSTERVDYPDFGVAVAHAVSNGIATEGVAICGSGIGIAMAANKVPGIRAATVYNVESARLSKAHNNANVICFGERLIEAELALESLQVWLEEEFEGGRHEVRIAKLDALGTDDTPNGI